MLNLVSGEQIRRYEAITTQLRVIFPYSKDERTTLFDQSVLQADYPKTWSFLKKYEQFLRKRDSGKLNDDHWYRYSRNQNLDKQALPKILIAGTARTLICTVDENGEFAANDKRVYTVLTSPDDLWYLEPVPESVIL